MALVVERIREQVRKAIEVAPFYVEMMRPVYDNDGRGGKILTDRAVKAYVGSCLFDNSGDGPFSVAVSDAGRRSEQSGPYLIIVYENDDQIREGDFFVYRGGRYDVTKVTNVLGLNIYWQVKLQESVL